MPGHTRWSDIRTRIFETPEGREAYAERRRALALGMQIRHLRELQHLSQTELARRAGTVQSAIARIEAGETGPKLSTLERISRALGTDLTVDVTLPGPAPEPVARQRGGVGSSFSVRS